MFRNELTLLASFLILITIASCNTLQLPPTEVPPNEGQTVIVTPAPGRNEISINLGDTLEVQIPTIPSEGYEWQVRDLDETILVQEGEPIYLATDSPDSAGGIVSLEFKAVGTGTTTLSLEYTSTGEDPALSKDNYSLIVNVTGGRSETVIVSPTARGNSAALSVGDILEVRIPTIPSEGYEWQVRDLDTSILSQEGEATYSADSSPDSAGGTVTLKFIAVGSGKTTLSLEYTNAGSTDGPAFSKNTFGMTVTVLGILEENVVVTPGIKEESTVVEVGEVLQVRIPTILSEGYEWQTRDVDTSILVQQGSQEYIPELTQDSSGGMVVVKFLAVGQGETTISLDYVNVASDEEPSFIKDTYSITVKVN